MPTDGPSGGVADNLDEAKAAFRAGGGFMGNVEITALSRRRTLLLARHGLAGAKIALYTAIAMSPKAPTRLECQLLLRKRGRKDFEYVQTQLQVADGRRQLIPACPQRSYRHWHRTIGDPQTREATGNISPPNRGRIARRLKPGAR